MAMDKEVFLQIPKLNIEIVKIFLEKQKLTDGTVKLSRTRSTAPGTGSDNITIVSIKLENTIPQPKNMIQRTLTVEINELVRKNVAARRSGNHQDKNHVIALEFTGKEQNISSAVCAKCSASKENCEAIPIFINWIQHKQQAKNHDKWKDNNVSDEGNAAKKRMLKRECFVLLERIHDGMQKAAKTTVAAKTALKKIQVEQVSYTAQQLELARELSMVQLIREFKGDDPEKFLEFCAARMTPRACDTAQLLTVGQADTDVWHELRVGRITASRMHAASRCTMMHGSLTQSIMGASSGFSFAMKRGTDLEGHVLAELRKEYPGLQNAGLILDPRHPWMGASPDGIADEFVLEIKCPFTKKMHACYVNVETIPPKYLAQIQLQMHVTQRKKALLAVAALDFEKSKQITQLWIMYDKKYVNNVMKDAYDYWRKAIFKGLLRKRSNKK